MSFVVRGELNRSSWELAAGQAETVAPGLSAAGGATAAAEAAAGGGGGGGGGLRLWREVNAAFPVSLDEMVSGPEDPRVLRLDDGATLVLVAAWEATKVQWQHALEIPEAEAPEGGDGRGGGEGGGGRGGGGVPVATRLEVDLRYAQLLRVWLAQFRQTSELRSREKNWSPFSWRGGVYLEYSLQPRLVLALNRRTGVCSPVLPLTSSAGVQAWLNKLGPTSGGPPSVLLPGEDLFLGLAHLKLWKKKGARTATSSMVYKHFWYTFEAAPPFRIVAVSSPFTLPTQLPKRPPIQFATG